MSDLSRLLEDLYRDDTPTTSVLTSWDAVPPPEPEIAAAPSWSSDEALDEAFASWVPGGFDEPAPTPTPTPTPPMPLTAVEERSFEPVPTTDEWTVDAPTKNERISWSPSDDDILPARRKRRFRLR